METSVDDTGTSEAGADSARAPGCILVVDDQRNMRISTALLLRNAGYEVAEADSVAEAVTWLGRRRPDAVLTDLRMVPEDGLHLLEHIHREMTGLPVVVMTAYGSVETAVRAMRLGAFDYLTKPFREPELLIRMGKAVKQSGLFTTLDALSREFQDRHGLTALVGQSPLMRALTQKLVRAARSGSTVLIQGESGTGKELVARALHALSLRAQSAFVPVNCAAIPETLLESELFGHVRGAFTGATGARRGLFEEASGGTLFIDEVSETTAGFQSKLLRALQEGEIRAVGESVPRRVDVRVIAASNQDLSRLVEQGGFRRDLYYRLNVVGVRVPALRERLEDIPLLAQHFLARANARSALRKTLTPEAIARLSSYRYPGNVRELENLIEQAVALSEHSELGPADFPLEGSPPSEAPSSGSAFLLSAALERAERAAIDRAVAAFPGDLQRVAEVLGISSTTLWRKMRRLRTPTSQS